MPNLDINIKTTADLTGAEKADGALKKVTQIKDIQNQTDKVKINQWAFYDLDAQLSQTGNVSENLANGPVKRLNTALSGSSEMSKKIGFVSREASYQIADFTTQVSMGTSAVTAFGMQAPNMINSFTQVGLVTGPVALTLLAVSAALPIITGAIKFFGEGSGTAIQQADKLAASLDKIATNVNKAKFENLDRMAQDLEDSATASKKLTQEWPLTQKAQAEFATAALTNLEKLLAAQRLIAEAMGLQVNAVKELEDAEDRASAKRKLAADQALAAEKKKLEDAQQAETSAIEAEGRKQAALAQKQGLLASEQVALTDARGEKKGYQQTLASPNPAPNQWAGSPEALDPNSEYSKWRDSREQAKFKLADPNLDIRINQGEGNVTKAATDVESLKRDLLEAQTNVEAAKNLVADTTKDVNTKMMQITMDQTSDDTVGKAKLLVDTQKQYATDIAALNEKLVVSNDIGKNAKDVFSKATADGKIVADEQRAVADAGKTLIGQLQLGTAKFTDNNTNVASLIKLMEDYNKNVAAHTTAINRLSADSAVQKAAILQMSERMSH